MFRHLPLERIHHTLKPDWMLDQHEVLRRRRRYGLNAILEKPARQWVALLKDTALDPMLWFLLVTGLLFLWLGEHAEAWVLLLAIIPFGGMDAFLHWRTAVSTQALRSRLETYATVCREGQTLRLPAVELVPGDLVMVKAGEYFPADGILLEASDVQVDESSLTGESAPVLKQALTTLPDQESVPHIGYAYWGMVGTRLLTGQALLRVVYTGKQTLYGEIVASVVASQHEKTPLQLALMRLVYVLIILASVFCVMLAVVRLIQGFGLADAILSAATLAVAALPDEFPMVLTFFLGLGVYRLAQKHALVRHAVSVENIGRVTTICTDKTGTVTEGTFTLAGMRLNEGVDRDTLLRCLQLASRYDSHDPLDQVILKETATLSTTDYQLKKLYPFSQERKRETALYEYQSQLIVVTKGAPETIMSLSQLNDEEILLWQKQTTVLAQEGYKVIACARANVPDLSSREPQDGFEWLGLAAFRDQPRPAVLPAVAYCQQHHIHVLMITGDHPETARKVAAEINLGNGLPRVMMAVDVEKRLESDGAAFLKQVDVIARAVPEQKLTIVQALKSLDEIVVVTGDGVNDVPALRAADIGVAMGECGTQSAREAADIVLLDDNFGSIVNAISEGKSLFSNLQMSFKYLLMIHIPYVLSATLIPLFGFPLLYFPIQIVCIELFIHPTCMLVFQSLPVVSDKQPRQSPLKDNAFFSKRDGWMIGLTGGYATFLVLLVYFISLPLSGDLAARADAFLAVGLTHVALTVGLTRLQSVSSRIAAGLSVLMLVMFIQVPVISHYFKMQPPGGLVWLLVSLASVVTGWLAYCSVSTRTVVLTEQEMKQF